MYSDTTLFTIFSHRGKVNKNNRKKSNKSSRSRCLRAYIVLTLLLISLSFYGPARADYFSAEPLQSKIESQTFVSLALTTPATTISINVSEYDPKQMIKNITLVFLEPVAYVAFVIDILKEKPLIVNTPDSGPIIQYYDIRYLTGLMDKIENATIVFAIEIERLQNMTIGEDDIAHYQYNGSKFEECPIRKISSNETSLLFETEVEVSSCFTLAGTIVTTPWWPVPVSIVIIFLLAIIGVYIGREFWNHYLRNSVRI